MLPNHIFLKVLIEKNINQIGRFIFSVLELSDGVLAIQPQPTYFGLSGDFGQEHFSGFAFASFSFPRMNP